MNLAPCLRGAQRAGTPRLRLVALIAPPNAIRFCRRGQRRAAEGESMQTTFTIETEGPGLTELTAEVARWLGSTGVGTGLLTLFVRHTSCSLLIQENADPAVQTDLQAFFRRLIPPADDPASAWITHRDEGPDDMPSHVRAAVMPVSLSIPVADGRLALGTWQGIYLFEHRTAPRRRQVVAHLA
jgi:secondary thiamine-phosphate synthase enzyme